METDQEPGSLQELLKNIEGLAPEEVRRLMATLAPGRGAEFGIGSRLRNAAIQVSSARTLVMLSGGLDSVALLYLMLKHEKGLPLHVHHVHLQGWESDTKAIGESIAIRDVTNYLWEQGYQFEYSESGVRYEHNAFDQTMYYFQAACLAASMPRVSRVAVGRIKEDIPTGAKGRFRVHPTTAGVEVFKSVLAQWPHHERPIEIVYPIEIHSKRDLPKLVPPELMALVCSCRHPVIVDDDTWEKCGGCTKCRE